MVSQHYAVDEKEVGIDNFLRGMPAEHTQEKGYQPLHDESVTLRFESEQPVLVVGMYPHTALATVDEVVLRFVFFLQWLHAGTKVDEQLIFVHPVGEVGEFLHHFVLQFVYGHYFVKFLLSEVKRKFSLAPGLRPPPLGQRGMS